jgi:hypothetical protein
MTSKFFQYLVGALAAIGFVLGIANAASRVVPEPSATPHTFAGPNPLPPPVVFTPVCSTFPPDGGNPICPSSWGQAAWFIDPKNTSTCASDGNKTCSQSSCTVGPPGVADGPCVSFVQIASRWGTTSPLLNQTTIATLMSSEPNTYNDIVEWSPACGSNTNGTAYGALIIKGVPTVITSGAIASGTNLSHSGNTLAHANFSALAPDSASLAVGEYVLDTTISPNVGMFLEQNTSGTVWNLTAPVQAFPTIALSSGAPLWAPQAAVATIGTTDTVQIETFPGMNLGSMTTSIGQFNPSACVLLENLTLQAGTATAAPIIVIGAGVTVADSNIQGQVSVVPGFRIPANNSDVGHGFSYSSVFYNVDTWSLDNESAIGDQTGRVASTDRTGGPFLLNAGAMGIDTAASYALNNCNLGSVDIEQDWIAGPNVCTGFVTIGRGRASSIGNFTNGITQQLVFTQNFALAHDQINGENGLWFGPGNWFVQNNANITYISSAANTFFQSGTVTIDGQTAMCSLFSPGAFQANTIFCGIPFSATNLAVTAGDAGFGNSAFIPGGARIWQATE